MRAFFWFITVTEHVQTFLLFLTNNASKLFKGEYYQPSKGGAVHAHAHRSNYPHNGAQSRLLCAETSHVTVSIAVGRYVRLLVENDTQQGAVDFDAAIVINEAQFS